MSSAGPTALIAEDEPLLAAALQSELTRAWPELQIVASVGDGASAVEQALALRPDVLFFDIRMPAMDGLEAAITLAEDWPDGGAPLPALVFVTAYDRHALDAFDAQAVDYVLKPVQPARLDKTVARLRLVLAQRRGAAPPLPTEAAPGAAMVAQLRGLIERRPDGPAGSLPPLRLIAASLTTATGSAVRMVPVDEVLAFDAADKYVRVMTPEREYLIRTPLRDLIPQLDRDVFWQIHRSTLVRAAAIDTVTRDGTGRVLLCLRGCSERFVVSRLYTHLFRAM